MHELKITMLGPSGVGKTSLLTAMYEQFETNIGQTNLQLTPDEESSAILQERLWELKSLLEDFEATGGIQGTEGEPETLRSFQFGLGKKREKALAPAPVSRLSGRLPRRPSHARKEKICQRAGGRMRCSGDRH